MLRKPPNDPATPYRHSRRERSSLGLTTAYFVIKTRAAARGNLSGRSVNCRYTENNRAEIKESRTATTQLLGRAISQLARPPQLWMNASTATIYRHALDRPMDEASGEIGGGERDIPSTWKFSIDVATSWEQSFFAATTRNVRKVALRSAMIMSPASGRSMKFPSVVRSEPLCLTHDKATK